MGGDGRKLTQAEQLRLLELVRERARQNEINARRYPVNGKNFQWSKTAAAARPAF